MSNDKNKDLEKFGEMEQQRASNYQENDANNNEASSDDATNVSDANSASKKKEFNMIEGYKVMSRNELPFGGVFYPKSWEFAYRCPTSDEVANFSTIQQDDYPKIQAGVADLIRKCWIIIDREKQNQVSSDQINDGERLFFFLKLREYYLHDLPIEYYTISQEAEEQVQVKLLASSLIYPEPKPTLMTYFDGRKFAIPVEGVDEPIEFLIPTLDISTRIYRYLINTYKKSDKDDNKKDEDAFNKKFLTLLPFLYVEGNESVMLLKQKYIKISKNEKMLDAYFTIVNKLNLTNKETIKFEYVEGSEEETQIKFPGGWKDMFYNKTRFGDIF